MRTGDGGGQRGGTPQGLSRRRVLQGATATAGLLTLGQGHRIRTTAAQTDGLPDPHAGEIPVVISRGVWHQYELYIKLPPTSGGNGMLRVWMDGVLAINRTDVSMSFDANNGWVQFRQDPIWGGVDDTKAHEDFLWYDHTYISAP